MSINVENFRDQVIAREAELADEVASAVHIALGSPVGLSVLELKTQIAGLAVNTINHLKVGNCTETVHSMLCCCFLRQLRIQLYRYGECGVPFTHEDYPYLMASTTDHFLDNIQRGYVVNMKRSDKLTKGRINRAVVEVCESEFKIAHL